MKKAMIQLETLTCPSCGQKIEGAIKSLSGIEKESINVMFNASKVKFNFESEKVSIKDVENVITRLGYDVKKSQVKDI